MPRFRGFLLLVDIEASAHITFKCPVGRITWNSMVKDPTILPAMVSQPILHLKRLASVKALDVDLEAAFEILRVHILGPPVTGFLFKRAPDKVQPPFIEIKTELVGAGHPDQDRRCVGNDAEPLLAFAESLLGALTFRDVASK